MKYILYIFFILQSHKIISQINYPLIKHLYSQKLNNEHLFYLNILTSDKNASMDSLYFLKAKFFLSQNIDSLFIRNYIKAPTLFKMDSSAFLFANLHFMQSLNVKSQKEWFLLIDSSFLTGCNKLVYQTYIKVKSQQKLNIIDFPLQLQKDVNGFNKINQKKPWLAAALSCLIPGAGKWYGSRPNSALVTFFSHTIYGLQTFESVKKFGIKNAFSVFSVVFFSAFYISNIYGSYKDLKLLKKYKRQQFLINAADYYNFNCPNQLY